MQVSLHYCYSNIRSWAHQDKHLVAQILLYGAIKLRRGHKQVM